MGKYFYTILVAAAVVINLVAAIIFVGLLAYEFIRPYLP